MSRSDNAARTTRRTGTLRPLDSLSHYDLVLAIIPTAILLGVVAGYLLQVPTRMALLAAALVGTVAMADALFLNPPIRPDGK